MTHTSRSKIVATFACPRYRYIKYHMGGQGLQRVATKHPTNAGLSIHSGNAFLLTGNRVDEVVAVVLGKYQVDFKDSFEGIPFANDIMHEQMCMIEGVIRAFNRIRLPQLLELGDVIAIERESGVELATDMIYDFRADALIRSADGIIVVDFKPSPFGGYQWVRQWERNHQVLAYVWAAQQLYPHEPVLGVQIEGYVRGKRKFDAKFGRKIQQSPLCYVYENEFSGQIVPDYQQSGGWKKIPLWDSPFSVKEYIEEFLTREQVEGLFLAPVPPICPSKYQIERWKRQTVAQEIRIEASAQLVNLYQDTEDFERHLDEHFPQNMDTCLKYGEDYECEMAGICFNSQIAEDPLSSGLYEDRVDHHAQEENID